jgi:hypothetical protein
MPDDGEIGPEREQAVAFGEGEAEWPSYSTTTRNRCLSSRSSSCRPRRNQDDIDRLSPFDRQGGLLPHAADRLYMFASNTLSLLDEW